MNEEQLTKEALTRELEHTIDEVCTSLLKKISIIQDNTRINVSNFYSMTYILEGLESLEDTADVLIQTIASINASCKRKEDRIEINILNE